jgi:hypothetical protein
VANDRYWSQTVVIDVFFSFYLAGVSGKGNRIILDGGH